MRYREGKEEQEKVKVMRVRNGLGSCFGQREMHTQEFCEFCCAEASAQWQRQIIPKFDAAQEKMIFRT